MFVYIYLDPRRYGEWIYNEHIFNNEPMYVGVGIKSRHLAHVRNVKNANKEYVNPILKNKIKSILHMGLEPIIIKIYDGLDRNEAYHHEISFIKHFGKKKDGGILANVGDGGEHQRIGRIESQCKPVIMFDLDGNRIMDYDSIADAQFDINGTLKGKGSITKCLKNKSLTGHGFIWKYKSDVGDIEKLDVSYLNKFTGNVGSHKKKVYCYNLDGSFKKEYGSAKEAMTDFGKKYEALMYNIRKENIIDGLILSYKNKENYVHKTTTVP